MKGAGMNQSVRTWSTNRHYGVAGGSVTYEMEKGQCFCRFKPGALYGLL